MRRYRYPVTLPASNTSCGNEFWADMKARRLPTCPPKICFRGYRLDVLGGVKDLRILIPIDMEIVLNSYGSSLSRCDGNFIVCNDELSQRVPVHGVTAVYVWRSTRISTDAILLALENDIDIVFMNRKGDVKGRVWNCHFGSIATIRKGQLYFESSEEGVAWIKDILTRKIEGQMNILRDFLAAQEGIYNIRCINRMKRALNKMSDCISQINTLHAQAVNDVANTLRGLEGTASRVYFQAIATLLPKELMFRKRAQRPAIDVVNAMLNYGYAILYNRVENALIKAGIDPAVGLLHVDGYNNPVFSYDVIEPYRCWIDEVVFDMATTGKVKPSMCEPSDEGVGVWLTDELRCSLSTKVCEYLAQPSGDKHGWSREHSISMDAQALAQTFKRLYRKHYGKD